MTFFFKTIRKFLRHLWRWLGVAEHHLATNATLVLRYMRLSLRSALSMPRETLVLRCDYPAGLFAEFGAVLGMLEHCESWRTRYAGVSVAFANRGLYYDPASGQNWWEYYFEPLQVDSSGDQAAARFVHAHEHVQFTARATSAMPRERGHRLIRKYIRVRPQILSKVDAYAQENFAHTHVIGIHYRGTDKSAEAPRVRYEDARAAIEEQLATAGAGRCRVFVATDEQAFLDRMLNYFGNRLIYRDAFRSIDGRPAHHRSADFRAQGEQAVIDCLLLSRCNYLVRTPSNLGLCATHFNPGIPTHLLAPR